MRNRHTGLNLIIVVGLVLGLALPALAQDKPETPMGV